MMAREQEIAIYLIVLLCGLLVYFMFVASNEHKTMTVSVSTPVSPPQEDFATTHEKASMAVNYFTRASRPTYTGYKEYMGGASNIYEYWELSKLHAENKLTIQEAQKYVR